MSSKLLKMHGIRPTWSQVLENIEKNDKKHIYIEKMIHFYTEKLQNIEKNPKPLLKDWVDVKNKIRDLQNLSKGV